MKFMQFIFPFLVYTVTCFAVQEQFDLLMDKANAQQAAIERLTSDPSCAWAASAVDTLLRREQAKGKQHGNP